MSVPTCLPKTESNYGFCSIFCPHYQQSLVGGDIESFSRHLATVFAQVNSPVFTWNIANRDGAAESRRGLKYQYFRWNKSQKNISWNNETLSLSFLSSLEVVIMIKIRYPRESWIRSILRWALMFTKWSIVQCNDFRIWQLSEPGLQDKENFSIISLQSVLRYPETTDNPPSPLLNPSNITRVDTY